MWNEHGEHKETYILNEGNAYKEHFRYNEKERNINNKAFEQRQFIDPYQNCMEFATHVTHATPKPMLPGHPRTPRYLADPDKTE